MSDVKILFNHAQHDEKLYEALNSCHSVETLRDTAVFWGYDFTVEDFNKYLHGCLVVGREPVASCVAEEVTSGWVEVEDEDDGTDE